MADGEKKCSEDEDRKETAAGNTGGSNKTRETTDKIGDTTNKTGDTSKTGDTTGKIGDTSKTGDTTGKIGDTTSKTGDTTSKTGDTTSKTGDTTSKTGDTTSKTGDTTSKTGDTTSKTGDTTNKTGDTTSKTGDTTRTSTQQAKETTNSLTSTVGTDKTNPPTKDTSNDSSAVKTDEKHKTGSTNSTEVSKTGSDTTHTTGSKLTDTTANQTKLSSTVTENTTAPHQTAGVLTNKKDETSDVKSTEKINSVKAHDSADSNVKSPVKTNNSVNTEIDKGGNVTVTQETGEDKQRLIESKRKETPGDEEAGEETIPLKNKEAEETQPEAQKGFIPARWIMAVLGCVGFMIVYGLKVNLSVAIIAMVNHTAVSHLGDHHDDSAAEDDHHSGHTTVGTLVVDDGHDATGNSSGPSLDECGLVAKKENLMDGPFAWDENVQGLILAAYFYGYLFTQVPGGWLAEKFSAKHVFGVGALVNALCALLTPVAASASYVWLLIMRIIMGIAGGVTLPAMHVLIAGWAPPQERSKISSTVYAGMTLGTLVCMPFSGLLAATLGWAGIFYVQGGLSIVWYCLWLVLVYDTPAKHPRISKEERKFIEESLGTVVVVEKPPVPWKSVWTSLPVWAIIVAHTCSNWGWYMLLVKLPTYMRYILKFDIEANAGLSAVPFLCMWIFTMLLANVLDALRSRKMITTTFARKLATFTASMPPAVCLIGVTYVGCNTDLAVALLTLGTMFVGGMYSGFLSNHIDIAPKFAGTLMGITNTFATFPGIIVPSFVGYMTHGNQTVEAWRTIFYITFGIFSAEAVFYSIFASGEMQEWAKPKPSAQAEQQKLNDVA